MRCRIRPRASSHIAGACSVSRTAEGPVQTAAFEIDGDVIRALYVVRNSDKLRSLSAAPPR